MPRHSRRSRVKCDYSSRFGSATPQQQIGGTGTPVLRLGRRDRQDVPPQLRLLQPARNRTLEDAGPALAESPKILVGLAPRNGRTSRTASCHSPRSSRGPAMSLVPFTSRRLTVIDENDIETPGPVHTQFDVLLDIGRARRTSDEIDG